MPQIRLGQVDMATGEILEGATLALFYPKRKNGFTTGWLAMAQEPLMKLARADLGGEAMRVLFAALAKLDFENYLMLNQAELARELELKRGNVSRAVVRLIEEGVLLAGPRIGVNRTYTLNPSYGWKGSARNHQEALKERMRARGMSVVDGGAGGPVDTRTGDLFQV